MQRHRTSTSVRLQVQAQRRYLRRQGRASYGLPEHIERTEAPPPQIATGSTQDHRAIRIIQCYLGLNCHGSLSSVPCYAIIAWGATGAQPSRLIDRWAARRVAISDVYLFDVPVH